MQRDLLSLCIPNSPFPGHHPPKLYVIPFLHTCWLVGSWIHSKPTISSPHVHTHTHIKNSHTIAFVWVPVRVIIDDGLMGFFRRPFPVVVGRHHRRHTARLRWKLFLLTHAFHHSNTLPPTSDPDHRMASIATVHRSTPPPGRLWSVPFPTESQMKCEWQMQFRHPPESFSFNTKLSPYGIGENVMHLQFALPIKIPTIWTWKAEAFQLNLLLLRCVNCFLNAFYS